jgi:hypothetical protein
LVVIGCSLSWLLGFITSQELVELPLGLAYKLLGRASSGYPEVSGKVTGEILKRPTAAFRGPMFAVVLEQEREFARRATGVDDTRSGCWTHPDLAGPNR